MSEGEAGDGVAGWQREELGRKEAGHQMHQEENKSVSVCRSKRGRDVLKRRVLQRQVGMSEMWEASHTSVHSIAHRHGGAARGEQA